MRILFVENHEVFAGTVCRTFLPGHEVQVVPSITRAMALLVEQTFDVVLTDYDLDDGKGDQLVSWMQKQDIAAPSSPSLLTRKAISG